MVRVVVEGAPPGAAGITIVRSELVVNARVPGHVLGYALHVVETLGGEHVAVELGVHVQRVIRRPQRETEVVHREHVLQQFRLMQVADAAGLARVVERVGQRVRARVEIVIVLALIDAHAPQHDGRVIPVAPDHRAHVAHRQILPRLVADVLPAGNLFEHQQPEFVAGVQKCRRLRIVRRAHDVAVQLAPQNPGIAALHAVRHGAAHIGERLVPVQTDQLDAFAVEHETVWRVARLAEADPRAVFVLPRRRPSPAAQPRCTASDSAGSRVRCREASSS